MAETRSFNSLRVEESDESSACDGMSAVNLPEHDRLAAVQQHPIFEMPAQAPGQHGTFDVPPDSAQLLGAVPVVDPAGVLLDDRALIEVGRDVVTGGADQLDAPGKGLVVRAGAGEGGEEAVVDVDDAPAVARRTARAG